MTLPVQVRECAILLAPVGKHRIVMWGWPLPRPLSRPIPRTHWRAEDDVRALPLMASDSSLPLTALMTSDALW